jgi:hypothetical protein
MDQSTLRFIETYRDQAPAPMFLQSLFQSPARNFHNRKRITMDFVRNDPRIAVPLPQNNTSPRKVEMTKYSNVEYEPPTYDTEVSISAYNAYDRRPGADPFQAGSDSLKNIISEAMGVVGYIDGMTRRAVELQCAQLLTTGQLSLLDSTNAVMYSATFGAKGTHFVTPTAWAADGSTGSPETDIEALAEVIRQDGKYPTDQLIMGRGAILRFLANTKIRDNMNKWNMNYGQVEQPKSVGGATFHGRITLGTSVYEVYSYRDTYIHPNTGAQTPYVGDNKVVVRSSQGRLDKTFGEIPLIVDPDARAVRFLPQRMSDTATGFDVTTNAWIAPNGKSLQLSVGTRALAIPTAADTFGCLTVF